MTRPGFASNRSAIAVALAALVVLVTSAVATARQADAPLSRYAPADDLFFLLEFQGLDTRRDAWERTASYRLLNETGLGELAEDLARQAIAAMTSESPPELGGQVVPPEEIVPGIESLARQGGLVSLFGRIPPGAMDAPEPPEDLKFVVVLRGVVGPGADPIVARILDEIRAEAQADADSQVEPRGGRSVTVDVDEQIGFWIEEEDFVVTNAIDAVIAALDDPSKGAAGLPVLAGLGGEAEGFVPVLRGFLDLHGLPDLPEEAKRLGLDGLDRVELLWGFQGEAIRSELRVVAPVPRAGLLRLIDQPTFGVGSLPPLPADLTAFSAFSIDLEAAFDTIVEIARQSDPQAGAQIEQTERALSQQLGIDLRAQVLRQLGPRMAVHVRPEQGAKLDLGALIPPGALPDEAGADLMRSMIGQQLGILGGLTVIAELKDRDAFGKALDRLVTLANQAMAGQGEGGPRISKKGGPFPVYTLELPPGLLPPGAVEGFAPTIVLGRSNVVLAATPALAQSAGGKWTPQGPFADLAETLPDDLIFLSVSDPRETVPQLIAGLPELVDLLDGIARSAQRGQGQAEAGLGLEFDRSKVPDAETVRPFLFPGAVSVAVDREGVSIVSREAVPSVASPGSIGVGVALLLPAVQAAREAARRAECTNNLRRIALAMQLYHDEHGHFPAAIADSDGRPLLGWQVALLPYLDEEALYDRFHLDEPWDSPHNAALLAEMPDVFACPSDPPGEPGTTSYRIAEGAGSPFPGPQGISLAQITDGTSFTIAAFESDEHAPWTRPGGLPFPASPDAAPLPLGSFHPGGVNAAFFDGSVRFIRETIDPDTLRALFTPSGGEAVDLDAL